MEFLVTASMVSLPKTPSTRHAPGCASATAETTQLNFFFVRRDEGVLHVSCMLPLELIDVGRGAKKVVINYATGSFDSLYCD